MEFLSVGTHLDICEDATIDSPVWRRLYGMSETPDMGGTAEAVDVTNLEDKIKRSIPGLLDYGELEFKFFHNKEDAEDEAQSTKILQSYTVLRDYQTKGKQIYFRLVYPDQTGFQWKGGVSVTRSAASVGAAMEFTLKTSPSSEVTDLKDITEE